MGRWQPFNVNPPCSFRILVLCRPEPSYKLQFFLCVTLKMDSYAMWIPEFKTARQRKDSAVRLSCRHKVLCVGRNVRIAKLPGAMPTFSDDQFSDDLLDLFKLYWIYINKFKGYFWKHKHLFGLNLHFLYL